MQSAPCTVTDAFNSQLKALCIKEFPCGFGTWRIPDLNDLTKVKTKTTNVFTKSDKLKVCDIQVTAHNESIEGLHELSAKPPYDIDCSWSNEASTLREIAVKAPNQLSADFILNHFKSLRIVGKKVTEIDDGLLQLKNLKKFTLSANLISDVDSKRLPTQLQELELSANQISDMSPLCISPPPLIHLGLGYNNIASIPVQMKPESWNHLLSLDMSYNNLSDLYNTINILKLLPKLRNLVMQGNPVMLVPGYRGYTIDSIRQLTILDDNRISADEKHYFKGLSKLKDIPLDEARLTFTVETITGVKLPEEIEDPENQPEYPQIEHKFHVEFKFLEQPFEYNTTSPAPYIPTLSITSPEEDDSKTIMYKDTAAYSEITPVPELKSNETQSFPWAEEAIEINYSRDFHIQKLTELRDFFKKGIEFSVIETKHSYVQEDPNALNDERDTTGSAKGQQDSKTDKRRKSGNKDKTDKDKRKESAKAKAKGKEGKGKGKGKHDDIELFELPREHRTLGSCHVNLASLLDGEVDIKAHQSCEEDMTDNKADDTKSVTSMKQEGGDKKKAAKGEEKTNKGSKQTSDTKKASKETHGKSSIKGGKDDKVKGKEDAAIDDNEEAITPPPLAIKICISLHQWKSAKEAAAACTYIGD